MNGYELPAHVSPWFYSLGELFSIYETGILKGKVMSMSMQVLGKYCTIIKCL